MHMSHIFHVAYASNMFPKQMQDAAFENKAALFTLATSDLMMVNMYVLAILCTFYISNTLYTSA